MTAPIIEDCSRTRSAANHAARPGTRMRARARGVLSALALATAALGSGGCGNIEPWVKPYERQALADPIMSLDRNPVSTAYMQHVFEAREGARGARGSAGGGCGCN